MAGETKTLVSWGSWPKPSAARTFDGCPSDEEILVFAQGEAPPGTLEHLHEHIDGCDDCQRLLVEAIHGLDAEASVVTNRSSWNAVFGPQSLVGGRYRIQRLVGRGGMGEVYEAYDTMLEERVALKTVTSTLCDNDKAIRSLKDEVQLARHISHPNVCRIYDLGTHAAGTPGQQTHFLTMEFFDGESLGARLREHGPLPLDLAQKMVRQLLQGLSAAHQAGILHRDLKSDNIMLRQERNGGVTPVILDFGLAKVLNENGDLSTSCSQTAGIVGTVSYMAPEQIEGEPLSTATDMYAFGVVWFEMLTGRLPFEGKTPVASLMARLSQPPARPSTYNAKVPVWLDEIVLTCLSRHRGDRFTTAEQVLTALEAHASAPPPSRWRLSVKDRKSLLLVLALVALTTGSTLAMKETREEPSPASSRKPPVAAPSRDTKAAPTVSSPHQSANRDVSAHAPAKELSTDEPGASGPSKGQVSRGAVSHPALLLGVGGRLRSPAAISVDRAAESRQLAPPAMERSLAARTPSNPSETLRSPPPGSAESAPRAARAPGRDPDWLPLWSSPPPLEAPAAAE